MDDYPSVVPSPKEFELFVKENLDSLGFELEDYRSEHREVIPGVDGEYEIDITARFTALNVSFLTLVECKRYTKPVEREKIQALQVKMQSVGAQKGIVFSTSGFQSGAIEFAEVHNIALVHVVDGRCSYLRRSADANEQLPWSQVPEYVPRIIGWLIRDKSRCIVMPSHPEYLVSYLKN